MLKYALRYCYSSFKFIWKWCLLFFLFSLMQGCSSVIERATICSYLFTCRHSEVAFDENQSIGFYATNGYWHLDIKRLVGKDSIYKINLVDYYSQRFEFNVHSLRKCTQKTWYSGCARKGLFKGVGIHESTEALKKRVNFSCECLSFDSEVALVNFLVAPWHSSRIRKLLSPDGVLICIDSFRDETSLDVTLEVIQLMVNKRSPSFETLRPYVNGTFRWHDTKHNVNIFFENIQNLEY